MCVQKTERNAFFWVNRTYFTILLGYSLTLNEMNKTFKTTCKPSTATSRIHVNPPHFCADLYHIVVGYITHDIDIAIVSPLSWLI